MVESLFANIIAFIHSYSCVNGHCNDDWMIFGQSEVSLGQHGQRRSFKVLKKLLVPQISSHHDRHRTQIIRNF